MAKIVEPQELVMNEREIQLPADPEILASENSKLRELLRRMREEADDGWRNADAPRGARHRARRDLGLREEVEALLGPTAWDALEPATHIAWGDQAICYWTLYPPAQWPTTQTHVKIADLIVRLPSEDETYIEFVARPEPDWNGVTCDACRVRLPALLRELSDILDDLQEGLMEGYRTHPDTVRAQEQYKRDVEPRLTAEQRQRLDAQVAWARERGAQRAARRARRGAT